MTLQFIQIEKGNEQHYLLAKGLWLLFCRELRLHDGVIQSDEQILFGLQKRIGIQGTRADMHFELALLGETAIGISMFAIDLGTVYGLLEKGCGTVMGFYIHPAFRRKGYGRCFYGHIEERLIKDGAKMIYLTPDRVTGIPFWTSLGFNDSGKIDPDDRKPIYTKACTV